MRTYVPGLPACLLLFSASLSAAWIKGKVVDPSGAAIPGAQVSLTTRTGVSAQTVTSDSGAFQLNAPDMPGAKLVVTAPGFAPATLAPDAARLVRLEVAPLTDSVQV